MIGLMAVEPVQPSPLPDRPASGPNDPSTSPRLRSMIAIISSTCSAVTTSGGPSAIQWGSKRQSKPCSSARRPTRTPSADSSAKRSRLARSRTNSMAWNSPLPRMSPMTGYFDAPARRAAGGAGHPAPGHWPGGRARGSRAGPRGRRRTRSGCPRTCAPRRIRGSPRSAPRRRRRSARGRSSPTAGHIRRTAPWRRRARRASRRTSRPRTSGPSGRSP